MNREEREKFWKLLSQMHDNGSESFGKLKEAYHFPEELCRFRGVTEEDLFQLRENLLYFSSADYYDDPFDSYFYVNYGNIINTIEELRSNPAKLEELLASIGEKEPLVLRERKEHIDEKTLREQTNIVKALMQSHLFSTCFCENIKNETLWLKYGDRHRGFVLVYKKEDLESFNMELKSVKQNPLLYPVYYSESKYDATMFAFALVALKNLPPEAKKRRPELAENLMKLFAWEKERISLIKKKCHDYDEEWRMLYPHYPKERPSLKIKPSSVVMGLRMSEENCRKVAAAAEEAGITEINRMYINDRDELDLRPYTDDKRD